MSIQTFNYLYCRNGHMLYGIEAITNQHCQRCGEPFLLKCESCGTPLRNTFTSNTFFPTGKPIEFPKKPDFCPKCGKQFPWHGDADQQLKPEDFWTRLHPAVTQVARKRFEDGHLADAVEAALKSLNQSVKKIVKARTGQELDGASLMRHAFSLKNPVIVLEDLSTETGKSIQQGYMDIFAGVMTGIRNPKAHAIITINEPRAIHFLYVASLLFSVLDETQ